MAVYVGNVPNPNSFAVPYMDIDGNGQISPTGHYSFTRWTNTGYTGPPFLQVPEQAQGQLQLLMYLSHIWAQLVNYQPTPPSAPPTFATDSGVIPVG
jgi:hypothetical protein